MPGFLRRMASEASLVDPSRSNAAPRTSPTAHSGWKGRLLRRMNSSRLDLAAAVAAGDPPASSSPSLKRSLHAAVSYASLRSAASRTASDMVGSGPDACPLAQKVLLPPPVAEPSLSSSASTQSSHLSDDENGTDADDHDNEKGSAHESDDDLHAESVSEVASDFGATDTSPRVDLSAFIVCPEWGGSGVLGDSPVETDMTWASTPARPVGFVLNSIMQRDGTKVCRGADHL